MSTDVARQRAEIEAVIAGRTLCDELRQVAEAAGEAPAYSDEAGAGWRSLTWSQVRQQVLEVAAGLAALGLAPGGRVALMLPSRSEHVLADLGAVHAGGLAVTLYATLAPEQIGYVAADCDARIAVLDGTAELARWQPVLDQLPGLTTAVVRDPAACPAGDRYLTWDGLVARGRERLAAGPDEITARVAAIKPGDPLALLYTSGTTGNPKGVVLAHRNILYEMAAAGRMGHVVPGVRWVSYLPLAHIAERMFSIYLAIGAGRAYVRSCQYGQATPPELAARFRRRPPAVRDRPAHPGRRGRPRLGAGPRHHRRLAGRTGIGPAGPDRGVRRSRRQPAAGPGAAGQAVAPAAGGVDRRDRGTDPHPQPQAPRRARQYAGIIDTLYTG